MSLINTKVTTPKQNEVSMIDYEQLITRLKFYISENYRFKKDFALDIGVSRVFLSEVLSGKKKMPKAWVNLIGYEEVKAYKKLNK